MRELHLAVQGRRVVEHQQEEGQEDERELQMPGGAEQDHDAAKHVCNVRGKDEFGRASWRLW